MEENLSTMPKVCVLLSTYNGEKYLSEQIESILKQENVYVILCVRDDGSTDSTIEILEKYQKEYPDQIHIEISKNIGWQKSYFELMKNAEEADYYAFSDQDDVWMPEKLIRAVEFLKSEENPVCLYAGNVWVTDEKLTVSRSFSPLGIDMLDRPIEQIMIQSGLAGGLTFVFTKKALELIKKLYPGGICGHDSWAFRTCLYLGKVVYDDKPMVYYRQHGKNAIGSARGIKWWIINKKKAIFAKKYPQQSEVAKKFLMTFPSELRKNTIVYNLLCVISQYPDTLLGKIKLIRYPQVKRMNRKENLMLHIKILLGKF